MGEKILYPHIPKKKIVLYPHRPGGYSPSDLVKPDEKERSLLIINRLARTEGDPVRKFCCRLCGECALPELLAEGRFPERMAWLKKHYEQKHPGMWGHIMSDTVLVEGGQQVPSEYRHLVDYIDEPMPGIFAAIEVEGGGGGGEGERKIDTVLKQLKQGVESIQQSSKFRDFLISMSKFHDYSIGNQILIMIQKKDATRVAGFNTWRELGRWVRKGEKGIAILAPVMPPRATCPQCGAKIRRGDKYCASCGNEVTEVSEVEYSPVFFRVVYVFDISQTEGKPLPEFEVPTLSGEVNVDLFVKVAQVAKVNGLTISYRSRPDLDPEMKGYLSGKEIWIRPEESKAQQLKTLLHELAHYYTANIFRIAQADAETIAESVAFVVGAHYGFDTGVRSFPYVALWAKEEEVFKRNLDSIRSVAESILGELEKIQGLTKR